MAITAVVGAGVIGAAGSVVAGGEQKSAADKASNTQLQMYNQTRADLAPYNQMGTQAFTQLGSLLGLNGSANSASQLSQLQNTPGYQFAVQQGQQSLDRTAASRGLLLSGGQLKDTETYGQGMADQLYNTTVGQLQGVAGLGENAAAQTGNAGTAAASGAASSQMAAGTAGASQVAGVTNQLGGILQNADIQQAISGSGGVDTSGAEGAMLGTDFAFSDRRLKTNIRRVGRADSGLPIYSYKLKGSPLPQMGVMSDEVRKVAPGAVIRTRSGYDAVNYDKVSKLPPMRRAA